MMILFWLICFLFFILCMSFFVFFLFKDPRTRQMIRFVNNGFRDRLIGNGFIRQDRRKYEVELWVWEVVDVDSASDECLERTTWTPMDIADWMKEGLPGTPESGIDCGEKCRCRLVRYRPRQIKKSHQS